MQNIPLYIPNILVSLSNFSFIYFISIMNKENFSYFLYLPMIASFIYHLAETKNNLPGIPYINKYSNFLLNIDRICAVFAGTFILNQIYYNQKLLTLNIIINIIIGFLGLAYSEKDTIAKKLLNNNKVDISHFEFTISHIIWHVCAFKILASTI